jgi:hypothetical protein
VVRKKTKKEGLKMSKEMKYVISDGMFPIIFSPAIQHSALQHLKPTSAGMCRIRKEDGGGFIVDCYGESISLKLKQEHDEASIRLMLNES